ncbi:MAG: helix-turn-helix domain-containing protein [Planctomycetota bacterium]|nr:helix-turn-helix domain-containing protein [Planctomycetota bacterium]
MSETPAYLTASECAVLLRCRQSKVLAWIRAGELPAADVSEHPGTGKARWRIAKADLDAFLAGRRPTPPATAGSRRKSPKRPTGWVEYL